MSTQNTYRQQIQAQIRAEMAKLKTLQTQVGKVVDASRKAAVEELARLELELKRAKIDVTELAGSSGAAMKELKSGVEKAYAELSEARKKAASKFNRPE